MTGPLEYRSFAPGTTTTGEADPDTAGWVQATALGFLEAEQTEPHLGRVAAAYRENGWTLWGAYEAPRHPGSWPVERPVATYAAFDRDLNVGAGRQLAAHLVAGVSVRTTHRRRGIMRHLIETDLRQAARAGTAIAALYAAEATIYPRFGFAPATDTRRVHVDTGQAFALHHERTGAVEVVDRRSLAELAPGVFDRYHEQTLGSIRRQSFSAEKIAGIWGDDRPDPDLTVRGAIHLDAAGRIDGYVAYRFLGWRTEPRTISIIDFIWHNDDAYFELWQHLGAIDLADRVEWDHAALTDPLPWALRDRRGYATVGGEDGLWLRILDVPTALGARSYLQDGEVTFTLTDDLGLTDGGYRLAIRDGVGVTDRADGPTDVELDVSDLAALYLGGVRARSLGAAGRVRGNPDSIARLDRLLAQDVEPVCATHF